MKRKPFVSVDSMTGFVAMWAARQSPYHCPDGLEEVLKSFHAMATTHGLKDWPPFWPCLLATRSNLDYVLDVALLSQEQVRQWNNRKNGREGHGFCSRYDKPSPDDDFIDLDALKMNIIRSCLDEDRLNQTTLLKRFKIFIAGLLPQRVPRSPAQSRAGTGAGM